MTFINRHSMHIGQSVLTDEQISTAAPSVFASEAHESRSARFAVIPTGVVIGALRAEGFDPVFAKQSAARYGRNEHGKHLVRFRHLSQPSTTHGLRVGATFPEVVLVNAQDGSSAYKLYAGVFRLVCLNGMIASDRLDGSVSVSHSGDVRSKVIQGSYKVLNESRTALQCADAWAGIELSPDEQHAFAEQAHFLRFADAAGEISTAIRPEQLLDVRRQEDRPNDLWTTFNRIQENAVRGGLRGLTRDPVTRRTRRSTSREVQGIDGDVRLNRALWALGARMAEIKA